MNKTITDIHSGGDQRITEKQRITSRITDTEERISEVDDRMVEINEVERKKEKELKEMRTTSEAYVMMLNTPIFESQVFQKKTKKGSMRKYLR